MLSHCALGTRLGFFCPPPSSPSPPAFLPLASFLRACRSPRPSSSSSSSSLIAGRRLYSTAYETLGVPPTANDKELREAFFKIARTSHPDKNPGVDQQKHFHSAKLAYELLKDGEQRRLYDLFLESNPKGSVEQFKKQRGHSLLNELQDTDMGKFLTSNTRWARLVRFFLRDFVNAASTELRHELSERMKLRVGLVGGALKSRKGSSREWLYHGLFVGWAESRASLALFNRNQYHGLYDSEKQQIVIRAVNPSLVENISEDTDMEQITQVVGVVSNVLERPRWRPAFKQEGSIVAVAPRLFFRGVDEMQYHYTITHFLGFRRIAVRDQKGVVVAKALRWPFTSLYHLRITSNEFLKHPEGLIALLIRGHYQSKLLSLTRFVLRTLENAPEESLEEDDRTETKAKTKGEARPSPTKLLKSKPPKQAATETTGSTSEKTKTKRKA